MIGAEKWVLEVLKEGYIIKFNTHPQLSHTPIAFHENSNPEVVKAKEQLIAQFLEKGAIEITVQDPSSPGFYSSVFLVLKSPGKWRPIINLRHLNKCVTP